jgi:hypothetical protein
MMGLRGIEGDGRLQGARDRTIAVAVARQPAVCEQ